MTTWVEDADGNRCSVERWGSEEAAKEALASNKGCSNCSNCSRCSRCSDCSNCSRCSDCSDCSDCSVCSNCSGCSNCSRCSDCSRCSGCRVCSGCSGCSRCYNLTNASPIAERRNRPPPVPVIPDIHKAIYTAASQPESLDMSDWHSCNATHCRAGWAVTLAGTAGKALEAFYGTPLAAMMIYDASDPTFKIHPSRFFDTNEVALADMKRLAEKET